MKIKDVYPLTPLQEGMFFHWKISNTSYLEQASYKVKGQLDIALLQKSYDLLVARHDALRTCFTDALGDQILQVVQKEVTSNFSYVDGTSFSEEAIDNIKKEDIQKGFELTKGSQMRLIVVQRTQEYFEFIWSHNHIIMDGWCVGLLIQEFFGFYASLIQGRQAVLPRVYPYSNYIKWLMGVDKDESLNYWKDYLDGFETKNTLPFPKNKTENYSPGEIFLNLNASTRGKIKKLCSGLNITENVFFQTLWSILLAKYNNTDDIVFGGVVSGRPSDIQGIENMIGLFINTIPVRISLEKGKGIDQILQQVQKEAIEGVQYHFSPINEIQEVTFDNQQLFDHILVFENYPIEEKLGDDFNSDNNSLNLELESVSFYEAASYDFSLAILPGQEEIKLRFTFNSEVYKAADINKMKEHFLNILETVLENPKSTLSQIDYVSAAEKETLLAISEANVLETNEKETLIDLFRASVSKNPENIALQFQDKEYTYKELDQLSDQLAIFLKDQYNVETEDFIGIQLDRSDWLVISILAIFKSGGVYVPLDTKTPKERVDYILEDAQCKFLIDRDFVNEFVIQTSNEEDSLHVICKPSHTAYMIYTSGSTGKPKGVQVNHHNIASFLKGIKDNFYRKDEISMPLLASNSFDIFLFELLYPLISGGKVCMLKEEEIKDVQVLSQKLKNLNHFHAVPTLMKAILETIRNNQEQDAYQHLESIFVGGDKIPEGLLEEIRSIFINAHIHVLYGPTEGTIFVTTQSYAPHIQSFNHAVIGTSNSGSGVYVLDSQLKLCPFDVVGELCITGNQVTQGYLNQTKMTASKFVGNPFSKSQMLYRTGDMVKRNEDGALQFVGRKDNQVKIRGYRIELDEVEKTILSHQGIDFVTLNAFNVGHEEKEIVAYFSTNRDISQQELIDHIEKFLPNYMVPRYLIELEEIPLNINGKVDKKRLTNPLELKSVSDHQYVAPTTETEIKLAEIWSQILKIDQIGTQDNFFHLGGHSLKIIKLVNQIVKDFGVQIEIKDIYQNNTIKKQSDFILRSSKEEVLSIPLAPKAADYSLSSSQERIWNLCTMQGASQAYNIRLVTIKERLDVESLKKAYQDLIERHEILRTKFVQNETNEARQFVVPASKTKPVEVDYQDVRFSEQPEKESQMILDHLFATSFDLSEASLLKVGVIRVEAHKWLICTVIHHIIFDEWSTSVFTDELAQLYLKHSEGKKISLSELPLQFKDYAVWENEIVQQEKNKEHKDFWLQKFKGELPVLGDFGDFQRPNVKTYNGNIFSHKIKGEVLEKIDELCKQYEISSFSVFFSLVNILLHKYTGDEDLIIGTPISNRTHPDVLNQIGFYANTIALRTRIATEETLLDVLRKTQEQVQESQEHQSYPFDQLINSLEIPFDLGRNPLFDVIITSREENKSEDSIFGEGIKDLTAKFDLTFDFLRRPDELIIKLQYNSDIYSISNAQSLMEHLEQILIQLATKENQRIGELEYLDSKEKEELVSSWNTDISDYPKNTSILELFDQQVGLQYDNEALIYQENRYTYGELDLISNRLANYLQKRFDISGDFVAIVLPRSEWQIISILAILKLNCAYVPIATDLPEERRDFIIKDTKAKCVIDTEIITSFRKELQDYSVNFSRTYPKADTTAYVMYTSGSTGVPKGVVVAQRSVVRLVKNTNYVNLSRKDTLLATGAFSFDATTFEYWGMLLNGGKLVLSDEATLLSPSMMESLIIQEKVNIMWFTAGWMHQLVDDNITLFKGLSTVLCGGDILSVHHISKLKNTYPDLILINGYGPTENTTFSITHNIQLPIEQSVPVGKPISNSSVYILDKNKKLVPKGVVGEICLGGDGLAKGYLNNEDLTKEKFIINPFNTSERLYKTGDLGKWSPEGIILFMGRKDTQVKLRGYRIELGAIESTLCKHQDIDAALVQIQISDSDNKTLVAYVVSTAQKSSELRDWFRTQLPHYMIPNHFILLDEFPLTINGKIDRTKLPSVDSTNHSLRPEYLAPITETEKRLVELWETILETTKIGLLDHFFDLGGHSLKAIKLFNAIQHHFDTKLDMSCLFNHPTIQSLAEAIDNRIWMNTSNVEVAENESFII